MASLIFEKDFALANSEGIFGRDGGVQISDGLAGKKGDEAKSLLEAFRRAEGSHHRSRVLVLRIHGVVELSNVGGGKFSPEISERAA